MDMTIIGAKFRVGGLGFRGWGEGLGRLPLKLEKQMTRKWK